MEEYKNIKNKIFSSPPFSCSKDDSLSSQPQRSLDLQYVALITTNNKNNLKQQHHQISNIYTIQNQQEELQLLSSQQLDHKYPLVQQQTSNHIPNHDNKQDHLRKYSTGKQSVVEEIVDFKNARNLQLTDFEQELQQPMMMSVDSQKNSIVRQLKQNKMKDGIQKIKKLQKYLSNYIKQQPKHQNEQFQDSFNSIITYILDFYQSKYKLTNQQFQSTNNYQDQNITGIVINKKPIKDKFVIGQQKNIKYMKIINKLQQQLNQVKLQNTNLYGKIQNLQHQNQQINQTIFDYDQKIAQIQLQVQKKVKKIINEKQLKLKYGIENHQQIQHLKKQYANQIQQMSQQILILQKKTKINEINSEKQLQIQSKYKNIKIKQQQLQLKQIQLKQLQNHINQQKILAQIKLQQIKHKQHQIIQQIKFLQQKQHYLQNKPNFPSNQQKIPHKTYEIYEDSNINNKDSKIPKTNGHKYTSSNYSFKLKKLAQLKSHIPKCTKNLQRQHVRQCQTVTTSKLVDMHRPKYSNNQGTNSISLTKKDAQISSQKSQNESQQLIKQKINSNISCNNTLIKSFANPISSTPISISPLSARSSTHQSLNHKPKIDDLKSKLENLREIIKKQISDNR